MVGRVWQARIFYSSPGWVSQTSSVGSQGGTQAAQSSSVSFLSFRWYKLEVLQINSQEMKYFRTGKYFIVPSPNSSHWIISDLIQWFSLSSILLLSSLTGAAGNEDRAERDFRTSSQVKRKCRVLGRSVGDLHRQESCSPVTIFSSLAMKGSVTGLESWF